MKFPWRLFFLLLGLGVFAWFLHQIGLEQIWQNLRKLGWLTPVVLFPFLLVYVIDAIAWKISFGRDSLPNVGFFTLFRIRWCGEAINYILPTAYVGGEVVKVFMLQKRGVSTEIGASASVVSKSCQTLAMVIFITCGAFASLPYLPAGSPARQGMMIVAALACVAIGVLFWLQRRGLFRTMLDIVRILRLKIPALEKQTEHFQHLDDRVRSFYRNDRPYFFASTLVFLLGWFADTLEILLVCAFLGLSLDVQQSFALEAFIAVAKAIGMFSPGSIGVQESGVMFLFHVFALPAAIGVSYALIRRFREFVFGIIGWALIAADGYSLKGLTNDAQAASAAFD
jgi:glycosyltransferase 2 family protein